MRRLSSYRPIKAANDPISLGPLSTAIAGSGIENYQIFEDKGNVWIFRTAPKPGTREEVTNALLCQAHGYGIVENAADLLEEFSRVADKDASKR